MSHYMKNKNENRTYLNLLATEYISPGCYGVSRFYPPLRGIVTGYFWNFDHFEKSRSANTNITSYGTKKTW